MSQFISSAADRAREVLRAGDTDPARFMQFFTDESLFRMGNNDPLTGQAAIAEWVGGYLRGVAGVSHEVTEIWEREDAVAVRVDVTYTMRGGETFMLPAVTRMRFTGDHLAEYHIFMDPSPVVAATPAAGVG